MGEFMPMLGGGVDKPWVKLELASTRTAETGSRNGLPEPTGYIWRAADRRREAECARILADIQARAAAGER